MTRRSGKAYAVDDDWRHRVNRRLEEKKMSRAALARAAGCSPSVITELLNGDSHESLSIPDIHEALGWSPPQPMKLPEDAEELLEAWRKLDAAGRARLLERAAALLENSGKKRP